MDLCIDYKGNKAFRLLSIYERLNRGELLDKVSLTEKYNVSLKTIQRDIDDLRAYVAETHMYDKEVTIKYDKVKNGYYLVRFEREWFTNQEVLALCKILLESRAFEKEELKGLITKLINQVVPNDRKTIERVVGSEYIHYVPLSHGKKLLELIWEVSQFILKNQITTFTYIRQDQRFREHRVKPISIMFSEYYFYLVAFLADHDMEYPTIFRIDKINDLKGTKEKFSVPYEKRFNDGEFRKRVQFMYPGELQKVRFEYCGPSIEAVIDRLPTAKIIQKNKNVYTIEAEVYGKGIDMWLRSQGDNIKIVVNQ